MKKQAKIIATAMAVACITGAAGCSCMGATTGEIKLTVWVSEADRAFAQEVAKAFQAAHPEKKYAIVVDIQGENDVAIRVLNDVENAADVYSFANDQLHTLLNGDALAQIAGERLNRVQAANSAAAMDSASATLKGKTGVYGMPYTDNTFFLYYNKLVLGETDVQTLDGILAKCGERKQFAFPMTDGWYLSAFYFGKGLGYSIAYDEELAEKTITCDFGNETGVAVTQAMWGLVQDKRVKADTNDSKTVAGFNDGSIVAAVSGIWNKTIIQEYLGDNFAAAKLPTYTLQGEQVQLVSFAGYKLMGVNNYSANKTDAMEFAEFFTNSENQLKHFEARGFVPTDENARKDERVQADACAKAITAQLAHSKTQKEVPSTLWKPMEGLGSAMITGAQSGKFDVQAQLRACVAAIEKHE